MELRIGSINKVWKHPDSVKLYCEEIDIKTEVRSIASGLQAFVPEEDMTGKVLVFSNLKVKKLAGFPSHGMVVCASIKNDEQENVELCRPADGSEIGDRVYLEGEEARFKEDEYLSPVSSKVLTRVFKLLKTDAEGNICYNDIKLVTKAGPLKTSNLKNAVVA